MTLLGWIIFIFALLFSIMLHEFGHFVTAKKFRMKVTQFFVGFGQTELDEDAVYMLLHGTFGDPQPTRDAAVRPPLSHQG